jgi:hypothetical protein
VEPYTVVPLGMVVVVVLEVDRIVDLHLEEGIDF